MAFKRKTMKKRMMKKKSRRVKVWGGGVKLSIQEQIDNLPDTVKSDENENEITSLTEIKSELLKLDTSISTLQQDINSYIIAQLQLQIKELDEHKKKLDGLNETYVKLFKRTFKGLGGNNSLPWDLQNELFLKKKSLYNTIDNLIKSRKTEITKLKNPQQPQQQQPIQIKHLNNYESPSFY